MSKYPIDWIIHFILVLCGGFAIVKWPLIACFVIPLFVMFMIEYEQKTQIWYNDLSWFEFIRNHALGDIVAGLIALFILYAMIY